jgi:single-strand DNA-binding protein
VWYNVFSLFIHHNNYGGNKVANYNKVLLMGNLTRDPELKYTPSEVAVCEFGMATNRKWVHDGVKKEDVCFVDVKAFGKQAETLSKYLNKGSQLFVEGRLSFQQWESKEGQRRSKLEVIVESFQFVGDGGVVKQSAKGVESKPLPSNGVEDDLPF